MPLRNVGNSVFSSLTIANKTGVNANIKKPNIINKANEIVPDVKVNKNIKIGFTIAANIRTLLLPILSETVPEKNVPPAPANWKIDKDTPAYHKLSPWLVK